MSWGNLLLLRGLERALSGVCLYEQGAGRVHSIDLNTYAAAENHLRRAQPRNPEAVPGRVDDFPLRLNLFR